MRNTKKFEVDLATALSAHDTHEPAEMTLNELLRAYDARHCKAELMRLKKWTNALGTYSAWAITTEQLSTCAQALKSAGYSPASPNRDLSALGTIYKWAISERLAPRGFKSPTTGVTRFKERIRRVFATSEEIKALRDGSLGFQDRRFGVFVNLVLDTGARKGEIYARRWGDVDLQKREIMLETTKNGDPRTLHFSDETLALMLRVFPNRPSDRLIFEGRVPGQPVKYRAAWHKLRTQVGRADVRLHDSRHFVSARMLRNGFPLAVAAQAIGNSPAVLAARYGHLETRALHQAISSTWTDQN